MSYGIILFIIKSIAQFRYIQKAHIYFLFELETRNCRA